MSNSASQTGLVGEKLRSLSRSAGPQEKLKSQQSASQICHVEIISNGSSDYLRSRFLMTSWFSVCSGEARAPAPGESPRIPDRDITGTPRGFCDGESAKNIVKMNMSPMSAVPEASPDLEQRFSFGDLKEDEHGNNKIMTPRTAEEMEPDRGEGHLVKPEPRTIM